MVRRSVFLVPRKIRGTFVFVRISHLIFFYYVSRQVEIVIPAFHVGAQNSLSVVNNGHVP